MKLRTLALTLGLVLAAVGVPAAADAGAPARALFAQGRFAEAALALEKASAAGELSAVDLAVLGECYTRLGRLEEAHAALERARRREPLSAVVQLALGDLSFAEGSFADAYECYRIAEALDPGSAAARSGMIASLVNRGIERYREGNGGEARSLFLEARALDPSDPAPLRNLAVLELAQGDPTAAAGYAQRAARQNPADPVPWRLWVRACQQLGDPGKLQQVLEQWATAQPYSPEPQVLLGRLEAERGDQSAAQSAFLRAEKLGSEDPFPYYWLGRASGSVARLQEAIGKAAHQAAALSVSAARRLEAARGELRTEDLRELQETAAQAEEPKQILKDAVQLLRALHADDRRFEEDLRRLSSWYPNTSELQVALGNLLMEQGRWEEARPLWERLVSVDPGLGAAQSALARCLDRLGEPEAAVLAWQRAIEVAPRDEEHYRELGRLLQTQQTRLLQILSDRLLRDSRNPVLLRSLAEVERGLGREEQAAAHLGAAAQLEAQPR